MYVLQFICHYAKTFVSLDNYFCSIGNLGWSMQEAGVQNVTVKTTTFRGTQNGLRIKTWARPSNGFVKGVLFQHSVMMNARYPILIDQEYCPDQKNCPGQVLLLPHLEIKNEHTHIYSQ